MGAYSRLLLNKFLDGIARRRGVVLEILDVELFGGGGLPAFLGDNHFAEGIYGQEGNPQRLFAPRATEDASLRLITNHRKLYRHTVGRAKRDGEMALEVGHRGLALRKTRDRRQLDGGVVRINNPAGEGEFLCLQRA